MNYEKELKKVMSNVMPFVFLGVVVTPLVGGWEALGKRVKTVEDLVEVIKQAAQNIEKSIVS